MAPHEFFRRRIPKYALLCQNTFRNSLDDRPLKSFFILIKAIQSYLMFLVFTILAKVHFFSIASLIQSPT